MFVEAVEGVWHDNPNLGRRSFLNSKDDLDRLKSSNISAVYVNLEKGIGVKGNARPGTSAARTGVDDIRRLCIEHPETASSIHRATQQVKTLFVDTLTGRDVTVEKFSPLLTDITASLQQDPAIFINITRLKTQKTGTFVHSLAVCALLIHFGNFLEMDEEIVKLLGIAGMLHDIGKLAIANDVLDKKNELTTEEMRIVEQHTVSGHQLLSTQSRMPQIVLDICRHHHERLDGKGYPDQLAGDEINIYVRMSTICDVFDALTTCRPYKRAWSSPEALSWMMSRNGQFDGGLLWKFILSLDTSMTRGLL
jgi:putative nucleotidyltransferase with HDIG domain